MMTAKPESAAGYNTFTTTLAEQVLLTVWSRLALDGRGEPKDAYDLVYVLRYYKEGPESVVQEIRQEEREQPAFQHAIATLRNHFGKPEQNGPAKYANFNRSEQNAAIQAYATVQEFLTKLDREQD